MVWSADDIRIEIRDDLSEDNAITARIATPDGMIAMMAEAQFEGRRLVLSRVHTHGEDVGPLQFGIVRLRWLAQAVMEALDCDEIFLEGATRTTGSCPGRRPRVLRFRRASSSGSRG